MENKSIFLIAGGTGLVGTALTSHLKNQGHEVRILSRQPSDKASGIYHWDPKAETFDTEALEHVDTIINLVGAGIADKRWTEQRKKELIDSRVLPTKFLAKYAKDCSTLEQYISASGINCYGYEHYDRKHIESDPFGTDYLSQVVQKWEEAADTFATFTKVTKVRISVVLSADGGALPKIAGPIKSYVGAPLGSGKQWMPWITITDLARVFEHLAINRLEGAYNTLSGNETNKNVTKILAKSLSKPLWLPNVPGFFLKLVLGEMSSVVLKGLQADPQKLIDTGFTFKHETLQKAFSAVYDQGGKE